MVEYIENDDMVHLNIGKDDMVKMVESLEKYCIIHFGVSFGKDCMVHFVSSLGKMKEDKMKDVIVKKRLRARDVMYRIKNTII